MPWFVLDAELSIVGRFWVEADTAAEAQAALEEMGVVELRKTTDESMVRAIHAIKVTAVEEQKALEKRERGLK